MAGTRGTIRGVRNPQAPSRPRGPRHRRYDPEALIAAGKWSPAQREKIDKVLEEFNRGTLKSSDGSRVTNKKQALAIALSEAKQLTAAGFDESKHKRHPAGKREGGRFAPQHGGADTPSLAQDERMASDEDYDRIVEQTADQVIGMIDERVAENNDLPEDAPDVHFGDAWKEELDGLIYEGSGTYLDVIDEGADAVGLDMDDETIDMEDSPYNRFDADVVARIRSKVPAADEYFGEMREIPSARSDATRGETASALTAAAAGLAPMNPPKSWFEKPKLDGPTPITVTADGQVYGHAALWGTCHTGMAGVCRTPPRSQSDYAYFHLGELDTDEGPVHVGRVTMDTGHAPLTASRDATVRHYDDTGTGAAHVRAYEDEHGIVLAGALMPDIPAEKARRMRGATVSGDWRSIGGKLELVGMLAVNVPGFPVPRAMAASLVIEDEPHTMALVAAGLPDVDPEVFDRKVKVLTARAMGGVDGLTELALGGSKSDRRMGVTAAQIKARRNDSV